MRRNFKPSITEQDFDSYAVKTMDFSACGIQGWRREMEDEHFMKPLASVNGHHIFAVFDGHAGASCSKFVVENFIPTLEARDEWKDYIDIQCLDISNFNEMEIEVEKSLLVLEDVITKTCIEIDEKFLNFPDNTSGSTGIILVVTPSHYICANVGDSRCVLGTTVYGGNHIDFSTDHKPSMPNELQRITNAGGFIRQNRVNGDLATARAFGDFYLKDRVDLHPHEQKVTVVPEIRRLVRNPEDDFVILACDGLWDVMSSEEAITFVREHANDGLPVKQIVKSLIINALELKSTDNISVMVGKLSF